MKFNFCIILLLVCLNLFGQSNSGSLSGTWELQDFNYGSGTEKLETRGIKRYKMFSPTHFSVIDADLKTGETGLCVFGTYSLVDSTYTEQILHANTTMKSAIGGSVFAILRREKNGTMKQISHGSSETWRLMKDLPLQTSPTIPSPPSQYLSPVTTNIIKSEHFEYYTQGANYS